MPIVSNLQSYGTLSAHVTKRVLQFPLKTSVFAAILKATYGSFQKGMTFCLSIHMKKVMKLLAYIFQNPSYTVLLLSLNSSYTVLLLSLK